MHGKMPSQQAQDEDRLHTHDFQNKPKHHCPKCHGAQMHGLRIRVDT